MNAILISISYHHGNTEKIAQTISNVLDAFIKRPQEIDSKDFSIYDLIGFGSGIYHSKHHHAILELAKKLPTADNQKPFFFQLVVFLLLR